MTNATEMDDNINYFILEDIVNDMIEEQDENKYGNDHRPDLENNIVSNHVWDDEFQHISGMIGNKDGILV